MLGIYELGWKGKVTLWFVKIVPYPAAVVDGKYIRMSTYLENINAQKKYYGNKEYEREDSRGNKIDFEGEFGEIQKRELERSVLDGMIRNEAVRNFSQKRGITVVDTDLDESFEKQVKEVGNREVIIENINKFYGWDLGMFKERFVRARIFEEKLAENIEDDADINRETKRRAEEVLSKIKRGEKFEDLAEKYSDDTGTSKKGGDVGYIARGTAAFAGGQLDNVVFGLALGENSEVVRSYLGYHIIKVTEKKSEDEYKVSHILLMNPSFSSWLNAKMHDLKIRVFVKDLEWDKEKGEVNFIDAKIEEQQDEYWEEESLDTGGSL